MGTRLRVIESACIVLSTVDQCVDMELLYPNSELSKEDIQKAAISVIAEGLNTINNASSDCD